MLDLHALSPESTIPALIYDPVPYEKEVLLLGDTETEDGLDGELAAAAKELGIAGADRCLEQDANRISTAISSLTLSSECRSSGSIRSLSTGVTSDRPRNSKEQHYLDTSSPNITALPVRPSYDSIVDSIRPRLLHSRSSSITSSLQSTGNRFEFSARRFGFKRKRGRIPSIFRRDSTVSSSDSRDSPSPSSPRPSISIQSPGATLDCGHYISKLSIRTHVRDATGSCEYIPISCCGKPVPGAILEELMTRDEVDELVRVLVKTYGLESALSSAITQHQNPSVQSAPLESAVSRGPSDLGLHEFRPMTEEAMRLEQVSEDPEYNLMQGQLADELERFRVFEYKQRRAVIAHYARALTSAESHHMQQRDEKERAHELELERLEETQITAELEMRKSHEDEAQRVATALKYMERYCRGSIGSGEPPDPVSPAGDIQSHTVSDEDRLKLQRQYSIRDNLPHKHESAINVLRAKQEKALKAKQHQQAGELAELGAHFNQQKMALEALQAKDEERLNRLVESRKRRVTTRWELKMEMWRYQYEKGNEILLGWLPKIEWPEAIPSDKISEVAFGESALGALITPSRGGVEDGLRSSPTPHLTDVAELSSIAV